MEPEISAGTSVEDLVPTPSPLSGSFYKTVASALHKLQADYERGERARLATLRRAAGKSPERDPLAWSYVLNTLLPDFPYAGKLDEANKAETAVFNALTLYALHQRSVTRSMHQPNRKSLGSAVAELTLSTGSKSIKSRLDTLMVARSQKAIDYRLRSLISLLHANEIPLDYAQLASDLWSLQVPEKREGVILRWGRDYALTLWKKSETSNS